ncbi:MAG TPA: hypothetical protein PLL09_15410 [Flavobacterium sp.]|uniref:hypothetical protein n=1 Tax=unclassified Flavobacterium TaxID=196869 RepID=UPI000E8ACF94|nr:MULTISPECIES: hypothetical protein [unclassified Flavobacterium]HBI00820.1 hypothetical protein [Flavobacterium sp.]HRE79204.1 hypothetical protein [Flavobacterium sp.]
MKKLLFTNLFLVTLFTVFSCSSDSDSNDSSTFKVDGVNYSLVASQGMVNIVTPNAYELEGETYNRNTFIISGIKDMTDVATVTFDLFVKNGESVDGTYQISTDQDEDTFTSIENILSSDVRVCIGWTSLVATTNIATQNFVNGNAPVGTIQIISNGGNNYTIKYNGNFKKLDQSNISVNIDLTGNVSNGS